MPILGAQIVTADDLNNLKPHTYTAQASGNLTGVVVNTDVPGASITLTSRTANAVYVATSVWDMDWEGSALITNVITGKLNVDGALQTREAHGERATADSVAGTRETNSQQWHGTLAAAGSHTLKLQASIADVDQRVTTIHTTLIVVIYEVV